MACDTFLKIAQKCKRHFAMQQPVEQEPFVEEILLLLHNYTSELSAQQVCSLAPALRTIMTMIGSHILRSGWLHDLRTTQ
jgi:hypothetical protein